MHWQTIDDRLVREYTFPTFTDAVRFINQVAAIADEMEHHPEIHNAYTYVKLTLSTHEAGDTITDLDHELADRIDRIV
jgi:4a-hydroxytetrahydrobiopterin dehydratase